MVLLINGIIWTKEMVLTRTLPEVVELEVDQDCFETAKEEGYLSDFLKFEISESFVFTPIKLGKYFIKEC